MEGFEKAWVEKASQRSLSAPLSFANRCNAARSLSTGAEKETHSNCSCIAVLISKSYGSLVPFTIFTCVDGWLPCLTATSETHLTALGLAAGDSNGGLTEGFFLGAFLFLRTSSDFTDLFGVLDLGVLDFTGLFDLAGDFRAGDLLVGVFVADLVTTGLSRSAGVGTTRLVRRLVVFAAGAAFCMLVYSMTHLATPSATPG